MSNMDSLDVSVNRALYDLVIEISVHSFIENDINENWKKGWLVGFVFGDGTYSKRKNKQCHRWNVSQSNKSVIDFAYSLCLEFNIRVCNIWEQKPKNSKKLATEITRSFHSGRRSQHEHRRP